MFPFLSMVHSTALLERVFILLVQKHDWYGNKDYSGSYIWIKGHLTDRCYWFQCITISKASFDSDQACKTLQLEIKMIEILLTANPFGTARFFLILIQVVWESCDIVHHSVALQHICIISEANTNTDSLITGGYE